MSCGHHLRTGTSGPGTNCRSRQEDPSGAHSERALEETVEEVQIVPPVRVSQRSVKQIVILLPPVQVDVVKVRSHSLCRRVFCRVSVRRGDF